MNNFSVSLQSGYIIFYFLMGLIALGISWWSYRDLVPQISSLKRGLLIALRSLGIFLIALLLLEPLLTKFSEKTIGHKLGVVFDLSSSMQLNDESEARYNTAIENFISYKPGNIRINYFGFSDSVASLGNIPELESFTGKATDLAKAISEPVKMSNDEIGALLLLTDGAGNIGNDPLAAAMSSRVPVYSLVVGKSVSYKDVALTRVDYPAVSYINTEIELTVEIRSSGYESKLALVEIQDDNKVIGSKRVSLPSDGAFTTATFPLTFTDVGVKNLRASISLMEEEAHKENNSRSFIIKLLKDKTIIFLMSSSLNWEFTFLKRALESDPHFEVRTAIAGLNNKIAAQDLPSTLEAWQELDLIIALDIALMDIGAQANNLFGAVESGIGFLFIAGDKTRYTALSAWQENIPISTSSQTTIIDGEFFPVPGGQAIAKTITDIDNLEWDELNPLEYIITNVELKSNAIVFLDVIEGNKKHHPVLVGGIHKLGKTAVILGYPWWKRSFRPRMESSAAEGMHRFWGNLVKWLVAREDLDKFNLESDKAVYRLGEPVEFSATLFDDNYNLISGAQVIVEIADSSDAKREFKLTSARAGRYSGIYGSPSSGNYKYTGYAVVEGDTIGVVEGEFLVESFGLEMENPSANYSLMQQIADVTGARSYTVENFSDFSGDLKLNIRKLDVFNEYRLTGNTYILIIVMLLFAMEWGIRKFSQLA